MPGFDFMIATIAFLSFGVIGFAWLLDNERQRRRRAEAEVRCVRDLYNDALKWVEDTPDAYEAKEFLRIWGEGQWDVIDSEWPGFDTRPNRAYGSYNIIPGYYFK